MFKALFSLYRPKFPRVVVYMLQSVEYSVGAYWRWLGRVSNFNRIMHRRQLVMTKPARGLLWFMRLGMLAQLILAIYFIYLAAHNHHSNLGVILAAAFGLSTPIVWAYLVVLPLLLGRWFLIKPFHARQVRKSAKVFAGHPGARIAIAGSYGKTTMKEILLAVLGQGLKVAATPANRNVAISHAQFAKGLDGDEDILIIEYGEGAPGDIRRFAKATHPNVGIITGLAPAHLDKYPTLADAAQDIFSLADYLAGGEVYASGDSQEAKPYIKKSFIIYSSKGVDGWRVSDIDVRVDGTSFVMQKQSRKLRINSHLIGEHLVGPLALAIYMADEAGLSEQQIKTGVAAIKPFEHRMESRPLNGGWLIDDTYNGNIEGMEAGLKLLTALPANRKIYITPGLVDQGVETETVHRRLGAAIAKANPDKVVLMKHSVTDYILEGLDQGKFKGELTIEDDPLDFYTNIDKFIAAGDVVLMQNDWPDQYE